MKLGTFSKVCSAVKVRYMVWDRYPNEVDTSFVVDYTGDINKLSDGIMLREKYRSYNVVDVSTTTNGVLTVSIERAG